MDYVYLGNLPSNLIFRLNGFVGLKPAPRYCLHGNNAIDLVRGRPVHLDNNLVVEHLGLRIGHIAYSGTDTVIDLKDLEPGQIFWKKNGYFLYLANSSETRIECGTRYRAYSLSTGRYCLKQSGHLYYSQLFLKRKVHLAEFNFSLFLPG